MGDNSPNISDFLIDPSSRLPTWWIFGSDKVGLKTCYRMNIYSDNVITPKNAGKWWVPVVQGGPKNQSTKMELWAPYL